MMLNLNSQSSYVLQSQRQLICCSGPEEAAFCSVVRGWRLSDTLHSPLPGDRDQTQRGGRKAREGARCGCVYYRKRRGFAAPSASRQRRGISPGPTWWRLQNAKSLQSEIIIKWNQIQYFHYIFLHAFASPPPPPPGTLILSEIPSQNSAQQEVLKVGGTAAPKPAAASAHPLQHSPVPAASGALPTKNKPWKQQQQQQKG